VSPQDPFAFLFDQGRRWAAQIVLGWALAIHTDEVVEFFADAFLPPKERL